MKRYTQEIINTASEMYLRGSSQESISRRLNIPSGSIWGILKNISQEQRKKMPLGYKPKHILPNSSRKMSNAKSRILGYISSEGHVAFRKDLRKRYCLKKNGKKGYKIVTNKSARIAFYNTDKSLIDKYIEDIFRVYNIKTVYYKKRSEVAINSIELYKDLSRYGSFKSNEWKIPGEVLASPHFRKEWLKAFYDGEAHIEDRGKSFRIILNSVNKKGLSSIKHGILNKMGITSKIYGPYYTKNFKIFRLIISEKRSLIRFYGGINFYHKEKKEKLQKLLKIYSY